MLLIATGAGTKEDGMDRPAPFVVRGLYTEYADFIYHPSDDSPSSAHDARSEAYHGQMMLLQEARDISTCPKARDNLWDEMIHFKDQRRGEPHEWRGDFSNPDKDPLVESNIFKAILLARVKFQYSNFPSTPDNGMAYRVAPRDKFSQAPQSPPQSPAQSPSPPQNPKRKRADSVVDEDDDSEQERPIIAPTAPTAPTASPRKRAKVLRNLRKGEDPKKKWAATQCASGN